MGNLNQLVTNRPTWDNYFIGLAYYVSTRSHDLETQVGCVIVSQNRVISMGYNGFCAGLDDSLLPAPRPDKYPFMVHAEENAISNMLINPPLAKTAYITHMPCNRCAKLLWQNGINNWIVPENYRTHSYSKDDEVVYNHLVDNGLHIKYIKPDFSCITKWVLEQDDQKKD